MAGPVTCPGFPGYCSESYVGDTCTVVCARGRNNVPQCQVTSDTQTLDTLDTKFSILDKNTIDIRY